MKSISPEIPFTASGTPCKLCKTKSPEKCHLHSKTHLDSFPGKPFSGLITIGNTQYPLRANIIFNNDINNSSIIIVIPFPEKYPKTKLRRKFTEIAKLHMLLKASQWYISQFYVFPSNYDGALPEERIGTKGIGKKVLCLAMSIIWNYGYIETNAQIWLNASGGICNHEQHKTSEIETNNFLKKFPETWEKIREYDNEEKKVIVCAIQNNFKLVEYYKREYGFAIFDDSDGEAVKMRGDIKTIINHCATIK